MNAYRYAFGSWANFIPGFPGLDASEVPWGLLWCLPAYIWLGVGAAILGCSILGKPRQTFPRMSTMAMYSFAQLVYMAVFFSLTTFWGRTQMYTYVSLLRGLTLWYGETYQLLLYEPFSIRMYCWGYTWLRDTRDAKDRCAIDREVDGLEVETFTKE